MATVDASQVYVGAPDQLTTGAILDAPLTATLPTSVDAATTGFSSSGYITEDGLSFSPTYNTTDLKDWSGATVRKILNSFDGQLSWSEMQFDEASLARAFGAGNVTTTAATSAHGKQITVAIGAELPPERRWVYNIKDGDKKVRICVPRGQVVNVDAITFDASTSINLPLTLACYPDASGKCIYIYTDDGVKSA